MKLIATFTMALLILFGNPLSVIAQGESPGKKHHLIIFFDNDIFGGTDQHYTNAIKFTWLFPDLNDYADCIFFPSWLKHAAKKLPYGNHPGFKHNIGISFGQHMYTPEDISIKELIEDDRPYAGCSYLSLSFHNKNASQMDSFIFSVGIVGPSSLADETQKFIHRTIGSKIPQGWDNQIKDEPALIVSWEHKWRAFSRGGDSGLGMDIIPFVTATAGNVSISGTLASELRFGYRLPHDFGTPFNRPGSSVSALRDKPGTVSEYHADFGGYISLGAAGYTVLRDIFLDGNTWKDSHDVDKKTFLAEIGWGVTLYYKTIKLTYSHIYRTKTFEEQDSGQTYGALNLSFSF